MSYDEHLISMAGGDGDLDLGQIRRGAAAGPWTSSGDVYKLLAIVERVSDVADWIRDNHGDYISREIEARLRAAITATEASE